MYHWKALNWLFKFDCGCIRMLPNNCDCCWLIDDGDSGMFGYCFGGLATLFIGWCWICLTGLWLFNWFIDGAGPEFFDLPDNKLSKSMFIAPAFVHVDPSGMFGVFVSVNWFWELFTLTGCSRLLEGWRILSGKYVKQTCENRSCYG